MKRMIAGLALALGGPAALAQSLPLAYGPPIRLEAARTLIDRAIVAAKAGGYCMAVAVPKVNKVRKSFAQYVRAA